MCRIEQLVPGTWQSYSACVGAVLVQPSCIGCCLLLCSWNVVWASAACLPIEFHLDRIQFMISKTTPWCGLKHRKWSQNKVKRILLSCTETVIYLHSRFLCGWQNILTWTLQKKLLGNTCLEVDYCSALIVAVKENEDRTFSVSGEHPSILTSSPHKSERCLPADCGIPCSGKVVPIFWYLEIKLQQWNQYLGDWQILFCPPPHPKFHNTSPCLSIFLKPSSFLHSFSVL